MLGTYQGGAAWWQQAICLTEQDGTMCALCEMSGNSVLCGSCNVIHTWQQCPLFYTYSGRKAKLQKFLQLLVYLEHWFPNYSILYQLLTILTKTGNKRDYIQFYWNNIIKNLKCMFLLMHDSHVSGVQVKNAVSILPKVFTHINPSNLFTLYFVHLCSPFPQQPFWLVTVGKAEVSLSAMQQLMLLVEPVFWPFKMSTMEKFCSAFVTLHIFLPSHVQKCQMHNFMFQIILSISHSLFPGQNEQTLLMVNLNTGLGKNMVYQTE